MAAEPGGSEPVPLAERSRWGRKIAAGEFVTSVEIVPPKGGVPDAMIERCRAIKEAGVDAVSVLDGPRAQSRMASVPSAMIIEREVGIETVFHYSCRDRNMMRMISDLLGAAAAGLHNILIITGDPSRESVQAALEAGASGYASKPFANLKEIIDLIDKSTERKKRWIKVKTDVAIDISQARDGKPSDSDSGDSSSKG